MATLNMNEKEAKDFVKQYYADLKNARFEQMLQECKQSIMQSIVVPFGLGKILSAYDKRGGNVDTIHNAREGVYATNKEKQRFENREMYNSNSYHSDKNYKNINKKLGEQIEDGKALDYLTCKKIQSRSEVDLDHIVSANEIHNDPGIILSESDGKSLANTESNLAFTDKNINRSKKEASMVDFLSRRDERIAAIEKCKNKRGYLTKSEINELEKLKKQSDINDKEAMKRDKQARKAINEAIDKEYYKSKKFARATATTSAKEGVKMGIQQALGLVAVEFFTAVIDEVVDICRMGFSVGSSFFDSLIIRIRNITQRVSKYIETKYRDIASMFASGFLSGILSNLATTLINVFMTTSKRLVRVIREGIFSFFRAIKLVLFPPSNISSEEAWHEAKKLLVSGIIVGVGVFIEQAIESFLISIGVAGFTNTFTSIIVGVLTGVSIAVAMYWLDTNQKRIEKIQYAEISKLVSENLPMLKQERVEIEILIEIRHAEALCILNKSIGEYRLGMKECDDEKVYNGLNATSKLFSNKEILVKNMDDVRLVMENPNRTGKLRWD